MEKTQKIKINSISSTNMKKDGTEIKNKFGKTSWRTTIQVPEYGQQFLTGFLPFQPDWKVGDVKELIVYEEEYNGTKQIKFKLPNKEDKIGKQLEEINNRLLKVSLMVEKIGQHLMPPKDTIPGTNIPYPKDGGTPEEIDKAFENASEAMSLEAEAEKTFNEI